MEGEVLHWVAVSASLLWSLGLTAWCLDLRQQVAALEARPSAALAHRPPPPAGFIGISPPSSGAAPVGARTFNKEHRQ